jgi:hypothetical protein
VLRLVVRDAPAAAPQSFGRDGPYHFRDELVAQVGVLGRGDEDVRAGFAVGGPVAGDAHGGVRLAEFTAGAHDDAAVTLENARPVDSILVRISF